MGEKIAEIHGAAVGNDESLNPRSKFCFGVWNVHQWHLVFGISHMFIPELLDGTGRWILRVISEMEYHMFWFCRRQRCIC